MSHIPPPVMQNPPPPHPPPPLLANPQIPSCGMSNHPPPWVSPPCHPPSIPVLQGGVPTAFSRPPLWDPRVPPPAPRMMPPSNYGQVPPPPIPLVPQTGPRPCPPPPPAPSSLPPPSCSAPHSAPVGSAAQWHQQTGVGPAWKRDPVASKHWPCAGQEQPIKNQGRFAGSQYSSSHSNQSYESSEACSWYYSSDSVHSQSRLDAAWEDWMHRKQRTKDPGHTRRNPDSYDKREDDEGRSRRRGRERARSLSRSRSRGRSPKRRPAPSSSTHHHSHRHRYSRRHTDGEDEENLRRRDKGETRKSSRSHSRHRDRRDYSAGGTRRYRNSSWGGDRRFTDDDRSHSPDTRYPPRSSTSQLADEEEGEVAEDKESSKPAEEEVDELQMEARVWTRCSPADLYFVQSADDPKVLVATEKLRMLHETFKIQLLERAENARNSKPKYEPPPRKIKLHPPKMPKETGECSTSSSCESDSEEEDNALEEMEKKKKHPYRLHEELWFNDPGEMNDGPLCRCSAKARRSGIRHGIYPGEGHLPPCDPNSNNFHRLHHYRITMSPHTNFLTKSPTIIRHDGHEFIFEGFSMFTHEPLGQLPICKVIRFNIEYTILYLEERFPENMVVESLELFSRFLFREILELVDLEWKAHGDTVGCPRFHFMPRFARSLEDNGKELLSMNVVLQYLLKSCAPLLDEKKLAMVPLMDQYEWQEFADSVKSMIVTYPGMKPCSLRVDQLDREGCDPKKGVYPVIVHFGIRPPQLSYAGNPSYQKAWRDYVKFRHLLANKPKVEYVDRHKLLQKEMKLQEMRMKSNLKRDVTVVVSSKGFYRTGIMCDIVQHAMLLPVLVCHLRFHQSLNLLESKISHKFVDRYLLQLALTHPSYRENFGTNPDHARNSLTNCGIRQPEYGDRRIHYLNTRKRGINTLINIMSRFGRREETNSNINHNERLEFLGDAVVEFLSSIHLFHMFPDLEEGGLATYRAAIVQNQHLAVLAKKLQLDQFMLYAHGSDLCHDLELRHAMANCFEALMGALFLDSGIEVADRVFSHTLFTEEDLLDVWVNYPPHPLQEQEPEGDRCWIETVPLLKKMHEFEEMTGIEFNHIRLLARAFTHRSVGFNNLTLGSNERLEFLGDTVLQLVASEYLYKYFPEHHEGHLSLLRSSLVNNRTQAVVCDDLGMVEFAIYPYPKGELKTKDRADLLEAFLGALYVDKGLEYCRVFCQVCFFPRLQDFIMNQDWNDPKSKLQQCCLTLRTMDGGEPDIPVYKVIECKGPTNTRVYTVAVYFRGERLATGSGHSIQQAEMAAAAKALESSKELFPQLLHQRRVIERSLKQQGKRGRNVRDGGLAKGGGRDLSQERRHALDREDSRKARIESKIPARYRIANSPEKEKSSKEEKKGSAKVKEKIPKKERSTKKDRSPPSSP